MTDANWSESKKIEKTEWMKFLLGVIGLFCTDSTNSVWLEVLIIKEHGMG